MNNEKEFEFLNDIQEEKEERTNVWQVFELIFNVICNSIILFFELFNKIITALLWADTTYTIYKTIRSKPRKAKRWF